VQSTSTLAKAATIITVATPTAIAKIIVVEFDFVEYCSLA